MVVKPQAAAGAAATRAISTIPIRSRRVITKNILHLCCYIFLPDPRAQVIKGWDLGVAGMRRGGTRTITCPPAAAYGKAGVKPLVPPNSTLVFEVTVV